MDANELKAYLQDIHGRLLDLDAMEQDIHNAKLKLHHQAEQRVREAVAASTTPEAKRGLLWAAYWIGEASIGIMTIFLAAGYKSSPKFYQSDMFTPAHVPETCACGKQFTLTFTRREQWQAYRKGEHHKTCPDCVARERQRHEDEERAKTGAYLAEAQAKASRRDLLHTMPYGEYLQTPEWTATRATKLRRAQYCCELCHSNKNLNVHHKTYERRGFEELSDLIVLCGNCHAKFHDKLPK